MVKHNKNCKPRTVANFRIIHSPPVWPGLQTAALEREALGKERVRECSCCFRFAEGRHHITNFDAEFAEQAA
jgi:hypothetical protein